jgi:hypothetical protein
MSTEKQRIQIAARQKRFRERQAQARCAEQQAKGLPALPAIPTIPGHSRWRAVFLSAHTAITLASQQMSEYYDERSEVWQEGDSGEQFAERQEIVDTVLSHLAELTQ